MAKKYVSDKFVKTGGTSAQYLMADGSVTESGGSGGTTNLTYTASSINGIVNSDTGTDATVPLGTSVNAGLLAPAQFTKLANTSGTNTGDNAVNTLYSGLISFDTVSSTRLANTSGTNTGDQDLSGYEILQVQSH
jgi:prepilin-type processing-associated H-X9-DG protein